MGCRIAEPRKFRRPERLASCEIAIHQGLPAGHGAATLMAALTGSERGRALAVQVGLLTVAAALWEAAPRAGLVDANLLPTFTAVMAKLAEMLTEGRVLNDLAVTAGEVVLAFAIVAPLGVGVGLL